MARTKGFYKIFNCEQINNMPLDNRKILVVILLLFSSISFSQTVFLDSTYHFKIVIPSEFSRSLVSRPNLASFFFGDVNGSNIGITFEKTTDTTLADIHDIESGLKNNIPGFEKIYIEHAVVNGYKALRAHYNFRKRVNDEFADLTILTYIYIKDGNYVSVSFTSEKSIFKNYTAIFERVFKTFTHRINDRYHLEEYSSGILYLHFYSIDIAFPGKPIRIGGTDMVNYQYSSLIDNCKYSFSISENNAFISSDYKSDEYKKEWISSYKNNIEKSGLQLLDTLLVNQPDILYFVKKSSQGELYSQYWAIIIRGNVSVSLSVGGKSSIAYIRFKEFLSSFHNVDDIID